MYWAMIRDEAAKVAARDALLENWINQMVLAHDDYSSALTSVLASKLGNQDIPSQHLAELFRMAIAEDPNILTASAADLAAIQARDPAAKSMLSGLLYYKGFHAMACHRINHWLWHHGRQYLARYLNTRVSITCAIDIHPGARVGNGVFIDHGTGIVVGETAVIGNDVSILQEVTLGGSGTEHGDRHPKVREGVLLGAGAKVLGNIEVGRFVKVSAGSVVLQDVPPRATVAGVPARIVGWTGENAPALEMNHGLADIDYYL
ncbi:MAG: serine O-acetyltransferase [Deltaproteobacteria bacterium]|nr:serine O-acetyltransferase [Deltaproteobacteria bacterium]